MQPARIPERLFGARWAAITLGVLALGLLDQCGAETFDLLDTPIPADAAGGTSEAGGTGFGGAGNGGYAGRDLGGTGAAPTQCGLGPCPEAGAECPPGTQFCSACDTVQDCPSQDVPFCDPVSRLCVACLEDTDCGATFKCNRITKRCDRACQDGADCPTQHPLCDPTQGVCVDCTGDPHCRAQPSKPYCWVGQCVECYDNAGCSPAAICVAFECQRH